MPPSPAFRRFSIPTRNWYRAVLAADGRIYAHATASGSSYVLEIDPVTETYTEHSTTSLGTQVSGVAIGSIVYRWRTGVTNNQCITFNTGTKTWGSFTVGGAGRAYSKMLVVGSKIYAFGPPTVFAVIDPGTSTGVEKSGMTGGGDDHGVLVGSTIHIPISGQCQLIDTTAEAYAGSFSIPARNWQGSTLAPNGLIYAVAVGGSPEYVLEIDPASQTYNEYSYSSLGDGGIDGILAMTGDIYWVGSGEVYRVTPGTIDFRGWVPDAFGPSSGHFESGALAPNARIYAVGWSGYCGVIDWRKMAGRGIGLGRGPRMIGTS